MSDTGTSAATGGRGPLDGYRVVEIAGIGPGPFGAMLLADLGADVICVERPPSARSPLLGVDPRPDPVQRGRRSVVLDLKAPGGVEAVLQLAASADAFIEGYRPGVAERLGVGPDACMARNPCLVYARVTGWGQTGPLSQAAGHDLNYIALTGMLHAIGPADRPPVAPLNLLGDYAGGGLMLAFGVLAGLLERQRSGRGQVIDAAMVDGAAILGTQIFGLLANGRYTERRESNAVDGGSHFSQTYETADGKYVCIASAEPQFYAELLTRIGIDPREMADHFDPSGWPEAKRRFAQIFKSRTRDEWCELLEGTDVCFAPVLSMTEAPHHPHNVARRTFIEVGGIVQPAPAPRFSRTPPADPRPPTRAGEGADETLAAWGFEAALIDRLRASGALR